MRWVFNAYQALIETRRGRWTTTGPVLYAVFVVARQFRMQIAEEYFQLWNSIIGIPTF